MPDIFPLIRAKHNGFQFNVRHRNAPTMRSPQRWLAALRISRGPCGCSSWRNCCTAPAHRRCSRSASPTSMRTFRRRCRPCIWVSFAVPPFSCRVIVRVNKLLCAECFRGAFRPRPVVRPTCICLPLSCVPLTNCAYVHAASNAQIFRANISKTCTRICHSREREHSQLSPLHPRVAYMFFFFFFGW